MILMQAIGILFIVGIAVYSFLQLIVLIHTVKSLASRVLWLEHGVLDIRMFLEKKKR